MSLLWEKNGDSTDLIPKLYRKQLNHVHKNLQWTEKVKKVCKITDIFNCTISKIFDLSDYLIPQNEDELNNVSYWEVEYNIYGKYIGTDYNTFHFALYTNEDKTDSITLIHTNTFDVTQGVQHGILIIPNGASNRYLTSVAMDNTHCKSYNLEFKLIRYRAILKQDNGVANTGNGSGGDNDISWHTENMNIHLSTADRNFINNHNIDPTAHVNGIAGNAATATKLKQTVMFTITDATTQNSGPSVNFDGSNNVNLLLPNSPLFSTPKISYVYSLDEISSSTNDTKAVNIKTLKNAISGISIIPDYANKRRITDYSNLITAQSSGYLLIQDAISADEEVTVWNLSINGLVVASSNLYTLTTQMIPIGKGQSFQLIGVDTNITKLYFIPTKN